MTGTQDKDSLATLLEPFGQAHLLTFWDALSLAERNRLAEQISRLNLPLIERLARSGQGDEDWAGLAARADSPPAVRLDDAVAQRTQARERGQAALSAGEVGVVLVAGGQGTRLGFAHPKGMYPIGPVSGHTLFQIHLEKIAATAARYGNRVPLWVMTSPATDAETRAFLAGNSYFGLPAADVSIFCQGTMPAVDQQTGKLLLAEPGALAVSPDGHGGMLSALESAGGLRRLAEQGIRRLFYFQVDNPLAPVCEPSFIGHHLLAESELTSLAVAKKNPLDRVGNFVAVDGAVRVIEYSDLPEDIAGQRDESGNLLLWAGSTAVHLFELEFLRRMAGREESLPLHVARKKVPYVDQQGNMVEPSEPNALKFERFIFDLLPHARNALVVEGDAAQVFAPLKNASGAESDTESHVHAAMTALARKWVRQAGGVVDDTTPVEISPRYALDADELSEKLKSGTEIREPTFLT